MNKEEAKVRIDSIINHFEWRHGGGTDYVESDRDQAHQIIDQIELVHQKVKLPREVGEAWIEYVGSRPTGRGIDNLDMALVFLVREECPNDNVQSWYTVTPGAIAILADAYRYGWEAEPEERFYVFGPESWENRNAMHDRQCNGELDTGIHFSDEGPSPLETPDEEYAFTRAELKKYHLDSDIFTLVPVGDEK